MGDVTTSEAVRERAHDQAGGDGLPDDNSADGRQPDEGPIDRLSRCDECGPRPGIVTVADLLTLIGRGSERLVESMTRRTLNHRAPKRKQIRSMGVW